MCDSFEGCHVVEFLFGDDWYWYCTTMNAMPTMTHTHTRIHTHITITDTEIQMFILLNRLFHSSKVLKQQCSLLGKLSPATLPLNHFGSGNDPDQFAMIVMLIFLDLVQHGVEVGEEALEVGRESGEGGSDVEEGLAGG